MSEPTLVELANALRGVLVENAQENDRDVAVASTTILKTLSKFQNGVAWTAMAIVMAELFAQLEAADERFADMPDAGPKAFQDLIANIVEQAGEMRRARAN